MKTLLFILFISLSWLSYAQDPDTFVLNHLSVKPDSAYASVNKDRNFEIYSISYTDCKIIVVKRVFEWEFYCVLPDGRNVIGPKGIKEETKAVVIRYCERLIWRK